MRVALVGTGFIAGAHAAASAGLPDVEIVAVTDRDSGAADRFATAWGARVVPDVADLLADEGVDALVVCTPNDTHASLARAAAAAGEAPAAGEADGPVLGGRAVGRRRLPGG